MAAQNAVCILKYTLRLVMVESLFSTAVISCSRCSIELARCFYSTGFCGHTRCTPCSCNTHIHTHYAKGCPPRRWFGHWTAVSRSLYICICASKSSGLAFQQRKSVWSFKSALWSNLSLQNTVLMPARASQKVPMDSAKKESTWVGMPRSTKLSIQESIQLGEIVLYHRLYVLVALTW